MSLHVFFCHTEASSLAFLVGYPFSVQASAGTTKIGSCKIAVDVAYMQLVIALYENILLSSCLLTRYVVIEDRPVDCCTVTLAHAAAWGALYVPNSMASPENHQNGAARTGPHMKPRQLVSRAFSLSQRGTNNRQRANWCQHSWSTSRDKMTLKSSMIPKPLP